jgi:Protein of unknown function (DUF732)
VSTIASDTAGICLRATGLLVGVVLLLLGPLGAAATARADTNDTKFLAVLKSEGITDHLSPAHAIEATHTVCQKLDDGQTPSQVASDVLNSIPCPPITRATSSARASMRIARSTSPRSLATPESTGTGSQSKSAERKTLWRNALRSQIESPRDRAHGSATGARRPGQ